MSDCIFCKIASKQIPAKVEYEDGKILAFADIHPKAPVHVLFIPKEHLATLDEANADHQALLGMMLLKAAEAARAKGVAKEGYRIILNVNPAGGQEVFHLHLHLMGGRRMAGMG